MHDRCLTVVVVLSSIGTLRGVNWYLGTSGESCDSVCASNGGSCPTNLQDYLGLVDTQPEVEAVFASVSITCNTYEQNSDNTSPKLKGNLEDGKCKYPFSENPVDMCAYMFAGMCGDVYVDMCTDM